VLTGAAGAVAIVVAVVLLSGGNGSTGATAAGTTASAGAASAGTGQPSAAASPSTGQWQSVLAGLEAARGRAYQRADPATLADVYQDGTAIEASDTATLQGIVSHGWHVSELQTQILSLDVTSQSATQAVLRVEEQLGAYDILDSTGKLVTHAGMSAPWTDDVTLVRTADGWRIARRVRLSATSPSSPPG
jgi:hypothetical protein